MQKLQNTKRYLCDNAISSKNPITYLNPFSNTPTKWCHINKADVYEHASRERLPHPQRDDKQQYWDYIVDSRPQQLCVDHKSNQIEYEPCQTPVNPVYQIIGGIVLDSLINMDKDIHPLNTIANITKTPHESLDDNIIKKLTKAKIVSNEDAEEVRRDLNRIEPEDTLGLGKLMKKFLAACQQSIEVYNTQLGYLDSTRPQKTLMEFLLNIPDEHFIEVLKGAYFTESGKTMYTTVHRELPSYIRFSSHDSTEVQKADTLLLGSTELHMVCGYDEDTNVSWCQFERSAMPAGNSTEEVLYSFPKSSRNFYEYSRHFVDSAIYFATKSAKFIRNILTGRNDPYYNLGPIGTSKYTEKNPLIMTYPVTIEEIENTVIDPKSITIYTNTTDTQSFTLQTMIDDRKLEARREAQMIEYNKPFVPNQTLTPLGAVIQGLATYASANPSIGYANQTQFIGH